MAKWKDFFDSNSCCLFCCLRVLFFINFSFNFFIKPAENLFSENIQLHFVAIFDNECR